MGYTHYWSIKKKIDSETWAKAMKVCHKLLKKPKCELDFFNSNPDSFSEEESLWFNGIGEKSCETFAIRNTVKSDWCKTARRPYDDCVIGCLIILRYYLTEDEFSVASDGDLDDWQTGFKLVSDVIGADIPAAVILSGFLQE